MGPAAAQIPASCIIAFRVLHYCAQGLCPWLLRAAPVCPSPVPSGTGKGGGDICSDPYSMAQAATPGGLRLPCSPKQVLALYQHLFRCPAGLGQLWAALWQVREAGHCL